MNRSFSDEIKHQWKHGGMHIKLIGVNLVVFLLINILIGLGQLFAGKGNPNVIQDYVYQIFSLHGDLKGFLTHPWGLFTSIFAHFGFMHFVFNMVFLYFISRFFLMYFSHQRMLYTYILGGIFGGLFEIIANMVFPALQGDSGLIVGASGAVMAIFMAAAFHRPMAQVMLFGVIKMRMVFLAGIFILMDLLQMGTMDNVAHFAHLGGIAFGILSIQNLQSKNNIVNFTQRTVKNVKASWKGQPTMKAQKGGARKNQSAKNQTDAEYNRQQKKKQGDIDVILDKISKSGYDSLTKREKQVLFDQSK